MRPCPGHLAGMMKALSSQGYVREILGARCEEYTSFQDDNLMRCPKPCILDSLLPEAPLGESCWNSPCHHLMLPGPEIVFRWSHTGTAVSLLVHIELTSVVHDVHRALDHEPLVSVPFLWDYSAV